ncbi:hypothetical protein [Ferrimonas marina]|uniref:hypothetical protein n=1 Tax=Ferrimonas marina TaxID=299255 RepID=UPI001160F77C|nr:hypothetical protein [Ferrimonas marina]
MNNDPWSTLALLLGLSLAAALLNDALFFRGLLDNLAERVEMGLYALMLSLPATGFALLHWPRLTLLGLLTALLYALAQSQILQQHVKAQSNHRLANGDTTPKA